MLGCTTGTFDLAGLAGVEGIQGFSHTLISYPECTLLLMPKSSSFLAAMILVQIYDGESTTPERKGELRR